MGSVWSCWQHFSWTRQSGGVYWFIFLVAQVANRVSSRCVEMMGGVGFIKDSGVEKLYRDSKIGEFVKIT